MLEQRAGADGRALGAQRDAVSVPVGKGVHLLLDDVCGLAHATAEQLRGLEQGQVNLFVGVRGQHRADGVFHDPPAPALFGQHVAHASDRLDHRY